MASFDPCTCVCTCSTDALPSTSTANLGYPLFLTSPRRMGATKSSRAAFDLTAAAAAQWTTPSLPPFSSRASSFSSSSSDASSIASSEGIRTPPTSPDLLPIQEAELKLGRIVIAEDDGEVLPFELEEVELAEKVPEPVTSPILRTWHLPAPAPFRLSSPARATSPSSSPRQSRSRAPTRPVAEEEDTSRRGRSRSRVAHHRRSDSSDLAEERQRVLSRHR